MRAGLAALAAALFSMAVSAEDAFDRTRLPIAPAPFSGKADPSLQQSEPAWPKPATAPVGAPNILLVLTDDVGFGASSAFGGPIPTPNLERVASAGARYNNFSTTAMCSPTRAALLTGQNHHAVGYGTIGELAMGFPGYNGVMPARAATIGRVLMENGYSTAFFGKEHNIPPSEMTDTGPYQHWPIGKGFQEFYGFIGADTDQWHPTLYHGTKRVSDENRNPSLILDKDLADHAIGWIRRQHAESPDKPFFVYFAPGTAHAPQQAPPDWIASFRGKFDRGWDSIRSETVKRQQALGIIPRHLDVTVRPSSIQAWNELDGDHRRLNARYMEVYAAMLSHQDAQFGRILDELTATGQMQNTLIIFIEGDNGASAEGGEDGSFNELAQLLGQSDKDFVQQLADIDKMGGPETYEIYPAGWAWALNAPFPMFKQVASHLGGVRNGVVIAWPGHIAEPGKIRQQFHHIVDIFPTLLSAAQLPVPLSVDGVAQRPLDGVSMTYTFERPDAASTHGRQYFEILGNRGLYQDGWLASTNPGRMPWQMTSSLPASDFSWSLYDLRTDFAQANDIAKRYPDRLAAMRREFDVEAQRNGVYPLTADMGSPAQARFRRPLAARKEFHYRGPQSIAWAVQPSLSRSFTIKCALVLPEQANGTVVATGSSFGGWKFAMTDGRVGVTHVASSAPGDVFTINADEILKAGAVTLSFRFRSDTPLPGSGGRLEISADGRPIAEGHIGRVALSPAGIGEAFDLGRDSGAPVDRLKGSDPFTGKILTVDVVLDPTPPPAP